LKTSASVKWMRRFTEPPAVVSAFGEDVDFFVGVLPDIAAVADVRFAIEGKPPGVSHAPGPDLRARVRHVCEWIVFGNAIRLFIHVDAEKFPEHLAEILCAVLRIAGRAAVAHCDVEHAIGPEADLATVVIR